MSPANTLTTHAAAARRNLCPVEPEPNTSTVDSKYTQLKFISQRMKTAVAIHHLRKLPCSVSQKPDEIANNLLNDLTIQEQYVRTLYNNTVPNRVPISLERCAEKPITHVPKRCAEPCAGAERHDQQELRRNYIASLGSSKVCILDSTRTSIRLMVQFLVKRCKSVDRSTYEMALAEVRKIDWEFLFGDDDAQAIFESEWRWIAETYDGTKAGRVLSASLLRGLEERIPPCELIIVSKRQKITYQELAFVLKVITSKVLKARDLGRVAVTLSRNYFTKSKLIESYRTATKRRLNNHKIARIIELLDQYGFIIRTLSRQRDTRKYRTAAFTLGVNNPHYKE